jgi:hypothetical protein
MKLQRHRPSTIANVLLSSNAFPYLSAYGALPPATLSLPFGEAAEAEETKLRRLPLVALPHEQGSGGHAVAAPAALGHWVCDIKAGVLPLVRHTFVKAYGGSSRVVRGARLAGDRT